MAQGMGTVDTVDKDKQVPNEASFPPSRMASHGSADLEDMLKRPTPEMRRPKPSQDSIAAALQAVQRLAAETDVEESTEDAATEFSGHRVSGLCPVCGYQNREGNKFCAMCGLPVDEIEESKHEVSARRREYSLAPLEAQPEAAAPRMPRSAAGAQGAHHYHHHYHHHYFPAGQESTLVRPPAEISREADKLRLTAAAKGESMSRAEAAVRRLTQEWVLACNTRQLDDLLDLYITDALVLRSNLPPVRGATAVREFFFSALDTGLGEVEVEPTRVEVVGDMAYEAGRCKALVPSATGKRREERGKYLWVFSRQSSGEWKLAADCWSSDLTLAGQESDITTGTSASGQGVKTNLPRKSA
jgi:uncharacterized protein (TIGR02246 family)